MTKEDFELWQENPVTIKFFTALTAWLLYDAEAISKEILAGNPPSQKRIEDASMKAAIVNSVSSLEFADLERLLNRED